MPVTSMMKKQVIKNSQMTRQKKNGKEIKRINGKIKDKWANLKKEKLVIKIIKSFSHKRKDKIIKIEVGIQMIIGDKITINSMETSNKDNLNIFRSMV